MMQLNRREFIQSAVAAAGSQIPTVGALADQSQAMSAQKPISIDLGWGFVDDPSIDVEVMAHKVITTMNRTIDGYKFCGWDKEPQWKSYSRDRDGRDVYKLTCSPLVGVGDMGRPIYQRHA